MVLLRLPRFDLLRRAVVRYAAFPTLPDYGAGSHWFTTFCYLPHAADGLYGSVVDLDTRLPTFTVPQLRCTGPLPLLGPSSYYVTHTHTFAPRSYVDTLHYAVRSPVSVVGLPVLWFPLRCTLLLPLYLLNAVIPRTQLGSLIRFTVWIGPFWCFICHHTPHHSSVNFTRQRITLTLHTVGGPGWTVVMPHRIHRWITVRWRTIYLILTVARYG